jgi:hypothetical protein
MLCTFPQIPWAYWDGNGLANTRGPTFTPDGNAVVFSTLERLVARNIQTGLEVKLPGDLAKLTKTYAIFAPNGKAVLTWGADKRELAVWDWPSAKKRFGMKVQCPLAPGFSPDGKVIFNDASSAERWDAQTGKALPSAPWVDREHMAWEPPTLLANPRLLIRNPFEGNPQVAEAGTGKVLPDWPMVAQNDPAVEERCGYWSLSPTRRLRAYLYGRRQDRIGLEECATGELRRTLVGHRGEVRVLGFSSDGTRLLTSGDDHTVLVWDVSLHGLPLTEAMKKETSATKLWTKLTTGKANEADKAMALLAAEASKAVSMARQTLRPAGKRDMETDATRLADTRAIELLESIGTPDAMKLLRELAGGEASAWRTREASRAVNRKR